MVRLVVRLNAHTTKLSLNFFGLSGDFSQNIPENKR